MGAMWLVGHGMKFRHRIALVVVVCIVGVVVWIRSQEGEEEGRRRLRLEYRRMVEGKYLHRGGEVSGHIL